MLSCRHLQGVLPVYLMLDSVLSNIKDRGTGETPERATPDQQSDQGFPQLTAHVQQRRLALKDQLIADHLELPRIQARLFEKKWHGSLTVADLEQEGMLGLIQAAESFEEGRGTSFKSWAIRRIRGAIIDALRLERASIGYSRDSARLYAKIRSVIDYHQLVSGRTPSPEEISSILAQQELAALTDKLGHQPAAEQAQEIHLRLSPERVERVLASQIKLLSIDCSPDPENLQDSLHDLLQSPEQPLPAKDCEDLEHIRKTLHHARLKLPFLEAQVLHLLYERPAPNEAPLTEKEIGEILGVTESRISQIKNRALDRLRNNPRVLSLG